jgi:thiol-disulfide isomerase/thioredoxin
MKRCRPRIALAALVAIVVLGLVGPIAAADPSVLLFYEEGCPDCEAAKHVLDEVSTQYPALEIERLDIQQPGMFELRQELLEAYGVADSVELFVPTLFVGDEVFDQVRAADQALLRAAVIRCATEGCRSPLPSAPDRRLDTALLLGFVALFATLYLLQGP